MKKTFWFLFIFAALAGILNCALIEPAFACKDEIPHSDSEETECCFIHCSMHHQWAPSSSTVLLHQTAFSGNYIPAASTFRVDSPIEPIFHPPLAR